jgi:hypothetical protein
MTTTYAFSEKTLPFRTDFRFAGAQCFLATNSHQVLRAAEKWRGSSLYEQTDSFEMELIVDANVSRGVSPGGHFRGLRHLVFASLPQRGFLVYDLLRKRVHGVLSAVAMDDGEFWGSLLLPMTIGVMGTTMGVAPLHCACLDRDGNALLVAGVSGAGKSTLTAALGQRGFAVVSDDWTYVSKPKCALVAHGLGAPIKLLPDAAHFFSELRGCAVRRTLNGEIAYQIEPRQTMGLEVKNTSRPRWILFLERDDKPGCGITACRREYVVEFFERSGERLPEELANAKRTRTRIIQQLSECPAWILRTGESPQVTAEAIDQFLREAHYATA